MDTRQTILSAITVLLLAGPASATAPSPDWAVIHSELRRPNVTLLLLWQEYHRADP